MFCVNCGKEVKEGFNFCAYCGIKIENKNNIIEKELSLNEKSPKGNWPIAIFKADDFGTDKYFAYDIATESETEYCSTSDEAIELISSDIEKWKYTVTELPTESKIKRDNYIKELLNDEFELINIVYLNINLEED